MTDSLCNALHDAEYYAQRAIKLADAICNLSTYGDATGILLESYRDAALVAELKWRAIERRADYPYRSRHEARTHHALNTAQIERND